MTIIHNVTLRDLPKLLWSEEQQKFKETDEQDYEDTKEGRLIWYVAENNGNPIGRIKATFNGHIWKMEKKLVTA